MHKIRQILILHRKVTNKTRFFINFVCQYEKWGFEIRGAIDDIVFHTLLLWKRNVHSHPFN